MEEEASIAPVNYIGQRQPIYPKSAATCEGRYSVHRLRSDRWVVCLGVTDGEGLFDWLPVEYFGSEQEADACVRERQCQQNATRADSASESKTSRPLDTGPTSRTARSIAAS